MIKELKYEYLKEKEVEPLNMVIPIVQAIFIAASDLVNSFAPSAPLKEMQPLTKKRAMTHLKGLFSEVEDELKKETHDEKPTSSNAIISDFYLKVLRLIVVYRYFKNKPTKVVFMNVASELLLKRQLAACQGLIQDFRTEKMSALIREKTELMEDKIILSDSKIQKFSEIWSGEVTNQQAALFPKKYYSETPISIHTKALERASRKVPLHPRLINLMALEYELVTTKLFYSHYANPKDHPDFHLAQYLFDSFQNGLVIINEPTPLEIVQVEILFICENSTDFKLDTKCILKPREDYFKKKKELVLAIKDYFYYKGTRNLVVKTEQELVNLAKILKSQVLIALNEHPDMILKDLLQIIFSSNPPYLDIAIHALISSLHFRSRASILASGFIEKVECDAVISGWGIRNPDQEFIILLKQIVGFFSNVNRNNFRLENGISEIKEEKTKNYWTLLTGKEEYSRWRSLNPNKTLKEVDNLFCLYTMDLRDDKTNDQLGKKILEIIKQAKISEKDNPALKWLKLCISRRQLFRSLNEDQSRQVRSQLKYLLTNGLENFEQYYFNEENLLKPLRNILDGIDESSSIEKFIQVVNLCFKPSVTKPILSQGILPMPANQFAKFFIETIKKISYTDFHKFEKSLEVVISNITAYIQKEGVQLEEGFELGSSSSSFAMIST